MPAIQTQSPVLVVDAAGRDELKEFEVGVTSALVHPLRGAGRVLGTLSVLNKVANDPLAGERFNDADQKVLGRLDGRPNA